MIFVSQPSSYSHLFLAGRIVNASSAQGRFASPFSSAYSISKFGVEALGDSLRFELHKFGIKVIILEPGNFASKCLTELILECCGSALFLLFHRGSPPSPCFCPPAPSHDLLSLPCPLFNLLCQAVSKNKRRKQIYLTLHFSHMFRATVVSG